MANRQGCLLTKLLLQKQRSLLHALAEELWRRAKGDESAAALPIDDSAAPSFIQGSPAPPLIDESAAPALIDAQAPAKRVEGAKAEIEKAAHTPDLQRPQRPMRAAKLKAGARRSESPVKALILQRCLQLLGLSQLDVL